MDFLTKYEGQFKNDTFDTCYIPFQNIVVKIKHNVELELITTDDLVNPIWESQIIKRDFRKLSFDEINKGEFYKFLFNVCGQDENRVKSLCSAIGDLIHNKYDPANAKAIIFYDEKIPSDKDEKNGRTGKSLVGDAIMQFKGNSVDIPGTKFIRYDKFFFQQCNPDTQQIVINELPKGFKLDNLFSEISEGMKVEQKREKVFNLKDAKILITTNSTIKGEGDSYKDRMFEIEFAPHYSEIHHPIDEFGHRFFDDWDDVQWLLFDNLMIYCVQLYLDSGLIKYEPVNIEKRKAIDSIPDDLFELFEELSSHQVYKRDEEVIRFNAKFTSKRITKKFFTLKLRQYCKAMGYVLNWYPGTGNADPSFSILNSPS